MSAEMPRGQIEQRPRFRLPSLEGAVSEVLAGMIRLYRGAIGLYALLRRLDREAIDAYSPNWDQYPKAISDQDIRRVEEAIKVTQEILGGDRYSQGRLPVVAFMPYIGLKDRHTVILSPVELSKN